MASKDLRKKLPCTVNILGTPYTVEMKKYDDDPTFKRESFQAYCWGSMKRIVIGDLYSFPDSVEKDTERDDKQAARNNERENLRHEIIHAYFNESGLECSSLQYSAGWAKNEEMVDWFAIQAPKIFNTFKELGVME